MNIQPDLISSNVIFSQGYEFIVAAVLPSHKTWKQWSVCESIGGEKSQPVKSWETMQSHHQLVIIEFLDDDDTVLTKDTSKAFLAAASFMFSIHNIRSLERHIAAISQRDHEWQAEISTVAAHVQEEKTRHGDVIIVNIVDVYRSLPQKLLLCHAWFHENYNPAFVMKTDDDCFVNLATVLKILPQQSTGRSIWWGNFRRNWAVDRHGKWREPNFSSSVYPKFACGSGYVVSNRIHSWLIQNQHFLRKFQGEDVSTGIWISGLDVSYIQDDRWQCAMTCQDDALSLPELNASMVWWHWNNSKHCDSPCSAC